MIEAFMKNPSKEMVNLMNMMDELKGAEIVYSSVRYISDNEEENRRNRTEDFDKYLKKCEEIENKYSGII
jgi:hypothetical protein